MTSENAYSYSPPERLAVELITRQLKSLPNFEHARELLDAVPMMLAVLNDRRQTVFANKALTSVVDSPECLLIGQRPGDILKCARALAGKDGCGSTDECIFCGAARAIVSGLHGEFCVKECSLLRECGSQTEPLNLRVWVTPHIVNGEKFVLLAATDISDEKKQKLFERVFYHDILNTVGALHGYAELLKTERPETDETSQAIYALSGQVLEQFLTLKQLLDAESHDLQVRFAPVNSNQLLKSIIEMYSAIAESDGKKVVTCRNSDDFVFVSDEQILRRVLGNMLKNAIEASLDGSKICICSRKVADSIEFSVNNPTVMSAEVQANIFRRSFSTKGEGRGYGTYSIRLLTERYLRGSVSFISKPGEGTTFTVRLPLKPAEMSKYRFSRSSNRSYSCNPPSFSSFLYHGR